MKMKIHQNIQFAKDYGMLFGLIFQIIDDLIDEIGTFKKIGKTPGKDVEQGKSTLLKLMCVRNVLFFLSLGLFLPCLFAFWWWW